LIGPCSLSNSKVLKRRWDFGFSCPYIQYTYILFFFGRLYCFAVIVYRDEGYICHSIHRYMCDEHNFYVVSEWFSNSSFFAVLFYSTSRRSLQMWEHQPCFALKDAKMPLNWILKALKHHALEIINLKPVNRDQATHADRAANNKSRGGGSQTKSASPTSSYMCHSKRQNVWACFIYIISSCTRPVCVCIQPRDLEWNFAILFLPLVFGAIITTKRPFFRGNSQYSNVMDKNVFFYFYFLHSFERFVQKNVSQICRSSVKMGGEPRS
jgi:hypothetical protein